MSNKKITQDMIDNIKNYNDIIKTEKVFAVAVRKAPGMYIGYLGNRGYLNMMREIFQNSIDEYTKKKSPCNMVIVSYDERNHMFIDEDNGRGIPHGNIIRIYTQEHTSSNYDKTGTEFSSGAHGVGAKVSNALAKNFIVESFILGKGKKVEFEDGFPLTEEIDIECEPTAQGTRVTMTPSYEALGDITVTCEDVLNLFTFILQLTKLGTRFLFNGIKYNGEHFQTTVVNEKGIMGILEPMVRSSIINPIYINNICYDPGMEKQIEAVFTFDLEPFSNMESIVSASNFCPTLGGTHATGFVDGVVKFFRDYMNKIYLSGKKNKITIIANDIKSTLCAVVSAAHIRPVFVGQAKDILNNQDMAPFATETVIKALEDWSKNNPKDLQKVCKYLEDVAELRVKSEGGKVKLRNKYKASKLTGLPSKFDKPSGKEHLELVIVEGDSAKGSAKNTRCRLRQGLYPVKGKIPNAFTTPQSKFLSNEEVSGLLTIISNGDDKNYGKNFDITKCPWEKIIIMNDADPDGAHIRTLILKLFIRYARPLIDEGRIFAAVPPLYGMKVGKDKKGKDKYKYFTTRMDYVKYLQANFCKVNEIKTLSGLNLSDKEIVSILFKNIDYVYDLNVISRRYSINPILLEFILIHKDESFEDFKKSIESNYRFLKVLNKNNSIVIEGLCDSKYHTIFLNEKLLQDSQIILKYINEAEIMYFSLNGEKVSLYQLMSIFDKSAPNNITRYKGLGEMKADQLKESTLHPDMDRTLMRYTVESMIEEVEMIKHFETNRKELIKGSIATRQDLLG